MVSFLLVTIQLLLCSAGTGLLSMMAARAMGSGDSVACPRTEGMVTACESYLPMVKLMRKVLHLNGMGRKINVINKRSDELNIGVDITSRADVLVSILFLDLQPTLIFEFVLQFILACKKIYAVNETGDKRYYPHSRSNRKGWEG